MTVPANRTRPVRIALSACLLAFALPVTGARAIDIVQPPVIRSPAFDQGDLQALQNRLSRQQFQNQQQQFRQDDRNAVRIPPPPGLDVPRMKPGCQAQIYGTLRSCR